MKRVCIPNVGDISYPSDTWNLPKIMIHPGQSLCPTSAKALLLLNFKWFARREEGHRPAPSPPLAFRYQETHVQTRRPVAQTTTCRCRSRRLHTGFHRCQHRQGTRGSHGIRLHHAQAVPPWEIDPEIVVVVAFGALLETSKRRVRSLVCGEGMCQFIGLKKRHLSWQESAMPRSEPGDICK